MGRGRVRWSWVLAILLAGLGMAGGWRWWTNRNFRLAMAEINAGPPWRGRARPDLAPVIKPRPRPGRLPSGRLRTVSRPG
jgi:hypothetical protein